MTVRRTLTWGGTTPPDGPCPRGHGFLNQPVRSLRAHVRVHKPGQKGSSGVHTLETSPPPAGRLLRAPLWGAERPFQSMWQGAAQFGVLNRKTFPIILESSAHSLPPHSSLAYVAGGSPSISHRLQHPARTDTNTHIYRFQGDTGSSPSSKRVDLGSPSSPSSSSSMLKPIISLSFRNLISSLSPGDSSLESSVGSSSSPSMLKVLGSSSWVFALFRS